MPVGSRIKIIGSACNSFKESYVEQSRAVESPLPGGKPRPGPLSPDSLLLKGILQELLHTDCLT